MKTISSIVIRHLFLFKYTEGTCALCIQWKYTIAVWWKELAHVVGVPEKMNKTFLLVEERNSHIPTTAMHLCIKF